MDVFKEVGNVRCANVTDDVDRVGTACGVDSGNAHNLGAVLADSFTSQLPRRTQLPSADADPPWTEGGAF